MKQKNKVDSSITISYKSGYIFVSFINGYQVTKFVVDKYSYIQYAKSVHSAKIAISKHVRKVG